MKETTLTVIHACRSAPLPSGLSHALLVLATYWPNVHPGQTRLAHDMGVSKRHVNRRLRDLEDFGLIWRDSGTNGDTTVYHLKLKAIRALGSDPHVTGGSDVDVPQVVTPTSPKVQRRETEAQESSDEEDYIGF